MSAVAEAAAAIRIAMRTVPGLRVYEDLGANIDPPGAVVGPPALQWTTGCPGPSEATFRVYLCVSANKRAIESLYEMADPVAAAIDELDFAVVTRADPGVFQSGGVDLPCLEISVDVGL